MLCRQGAFELYWELDTVKVRITLRYVLENLT